MKKWTDYKNDSCNNTLRSESAFIFQFELFEPARLDSGRDLSPLKSGEAKILLADISLLEKNSVDPSKVLKDPVEIQTWKRRKNPVQAQEFLCSRWLIQQVVPSLLPLKGKTEWKLSTQAAGRLELQPPGLLHLNLSHSHGMIALIFSLAEVSIDIEVEDTKFDFESVLTHQLDPKEQSWINGSQNRRQAFYATWCRHEARVKLAPKNNDFVVLKSFLAPSKGRPLLHLSCGSYHELELQIFSFLSGE